MTQQILEAQFNNYQWIVLFTQNKLPNHPGWKAGYHPDHIVPTFEIIFTITTKILIEHRNSSTAV